MSVQDGGAISARSHRSPRRPGIATPLFRRTPEGRPRPSTNQRPIRRSPPVVRRTGRMLSRFTKCPEAGPCPRRTSRQRGPARPDRDGPRRYEVAMVPGLPSESCPRREAFQRALAAFVEGGSRSSRDVYRGDHQVAECPPRCLRSQECPGVRSRAVSPRRRSAIDRRRAGVGQLGAR